MDQQQQTKWFFESTASAWQMKASGETPSYNIVEGRHRAVLAVLKELGKVRRFLDVGCGTGQLTVEVARQGVDATGIDFAAEMIAQCEANRQKAGVAAKFINASFFDLPTPPEPYDVISAQGFIEYISHEQMEEFFACCSEMLRPGGALVVGSRNRLFNVHSVNKFTTIEAKLGVLEKLVAEASALQQSRSQHAAFEAICEVEGIDPQPSEHPWTGVGVDVRYQYTPSELAMRLRKHAFRPCALYPVHYHGLPVSVVAEQPALHRDIALAVEHLYGADQRIVPFCSSFVLDVRKAP